MDQAWLHGAFELHKDGGNWRGYLMEAFRAGRIDSDELQAVTEFFESRS